MKTLYALALALSLTPLIGCSSTPTGLDRTFADVKTNYVPVLVLATNVVTVTNAQNVPVFQTNVVTATNLVPVYVETVKTNWVTAIGAGGSVINTTVPGVGTLVSTGLLGLLSIFLGIRNRQFAGQNTALSQSAGVLAQIIETGREVLAKTPQGQNAANAFTQWMVTHQADTNTIAQITQIVKDSTDNQEAQKAADQILALMGQPPTKA